LAMADHLLPLVSWALMMTASSHSENAPFFTAGLRWFHHLQMQHHAEHSAGERQN
jgi:hypothetical protein